MRLLVPTLAIPILLACAGSAPPPEEEGGGRGTEPGRVDTVELVPEPLRIAAPVRIETPRREAIRDSSTWSAVWREATAGTVPRPELPAVDFAARTLLLAAAGFKPSGGYGVSIESARLIGDTLHVDVTERAPGERCMTTQALTYPVAIVTVERVDAEAAFHVREETRDC